MLRVIKFALRYGHDLTPDTLAAVRSNAGKLKNAEPDAVAAILANIVLKESTYKEAIKWMDRLGLLTVLAEMLTDTGQKTRQFRTTMQNYVNSQKMDMVFALMDVGLPLGAAVNFLSSEEQQRVREIALGMDRDEAWEFLGMLRKPGNAFKDRDFQPGLERKYGITKKQKGRFYPIVARANRALLLADPTLAHNPSKLRQLVERQVEIDMRNTRLAALRHDPWKQDTDHKGRPRWRTTGYDVGSTYTFQITETGPNNYEWWTEVEHRMGGVDSLDGSARSVAEAARAMGIRPPRMAHRVASRFIGRTATFGGKVTGDRSSVGLFLPLPEHLAEQYPALSEDDSPSHSTLLYVGPVEAGREKDFLAVLENVIGHEPGPIQAWLNGVDQFVHPDQDRTVFYTPVRFSRDVGELRDRIWVALEEAGFEVNHRFPLAFFPHVTLEYADSTDARYDGPVPDGAWEFDTIQVWGLPKVVDVHLGRFDQHLLGLRERQEADLLTAWGELLG
jgi:2'-5' RNA ligase